MPATGYLDGGQSEALRAAGASPAVAAGDITDAAITIAETEAGTVGTAVSPGSSESQGEVDALAAPAIAEATIVPASAAVNCDEWNTGVFFERATADVVTTCLAAGADVAARDDDLITAAPETHPSVRGSSCAVHSGSVHLATVRSDSIDLGEA